MWGRSKLGILVAATAALLAASGPATASAAVRFADPAGTGTSFSSCSEFTVPQCSIEGAVDGAVGGDEVILRPGTYMTTEGLDIDLGFDVHGQDGQPTPTVTWAASPVDNDPIFNLIGPGKLRNVVVDSSRANSSIPSALTISDPAAVVDGVFAHSSINNSPAFACKVEAGTIRDSVCWSSAGTGSGGLGSFFNDAMTRSATLRNVTAIGSGTNTHGISYDQISTGTTNISAKSVIASSSGTAAAIHAGAGAGATTAITLDHSLYASEDEIAISGSTATITDPGSGTNIFGPALLSADFHQLAGSPSIDAGAIDASSGTTDIDREARVQGAAADIGADEFVPASSSGGGSTPATDTKPPITTIGKGPKKKTTKHKAKFQFVSNEPGSSFKCKLDKKAFAACSSPKTVKVKTGKHTFKVEAVDPAGNIDPTPAVFHWKVLSG